MFTSLLNISIPASLIWFFIGSLTLIFEFIAPAFILFFIGFSALIVSMVCLLFPISLNLQLILFIAFSILGLLFLRQHLKTWISHKQTTPSIDDLSDYIGKHVSVVETITPTQNGKVEFQGSTWRACSTHTLLSGQSARIIKVDNITLHVEALEKGEPSWE